MEVVNIIKFNWFFINLKGMRNYRYRLYKFVNEEKYCYLNWRDRLDYWLKGYDRNKWNYWWKGLKLGLEFFLKVKESYEIVIIWN